MSYKREPTLLGRVMSRHKVLENGCWQWTGHITKYGYGRMAFDGVQVMAHRASYESIVGPIPEGLQLDHLCRNRACVNPAHLEPVTSKVNTLRGFNTAALNARKTHCKRGHELSGENLKLEKRGGRQCYTCDAMRMAAFYRRKGIHFE